MTMIDLSDPLVRELFRKLAQLERRMEANQPATFTHYCGTKTTDFTTTDLPHHGDYGYQTTDLEVQMNCDGAVRAIDSDDELRLIWLGW